MASTQKRVNNFLEKLTEIVRSNLENEQFGVSELAREMGMSRSNLHRKVRAETGKSVSMFIRHLRLVEASMLLRQTSLTASEVAFKCGFNSVSYFNRCFHDEYGYPPGQAGKIEEEDLDTDNIQVQGIGPVSKNKKIFICLISAVSVIIIAIIIYILFQPFSSTSTSLEKSIAVLPFINDSPDKTDTYFIDGSMESILDNLCKIKDLRVIPRTSVIQYREHPKTATEIARELHVSYILEGSGQKYGDNIRLTLQLIDAVQEKHIWSQTYDREISKIENLFSLQSEIALLVADKIKATVTPDEEQRIKKVPTKSPTAVDFYLRGHYAAVRYHVYNENESFVRAKRLYRLALEYDSTLAVAWLGLASLHWLEDNMYSYLSEDYMDSALILANIALSYDDQISWGYTIRGAYLYSTSGGMINEASRELKKALKYNPNDWGAYRILGNMYYDRDFVKSIQYLQESASRNTSLELTGILRQVGFHYLGAGFPEKAKHCHHEVFLLDNDTATYYLELEHIEYWQGNYEKAIEIGKMVLEIDSILLWGQIWLAANYRSIGQYTESIKYFQKSQEEHSSEELGFYYPFGWAGHVYSVNGYREQADQYFNKQINIADRAIELGRPDLRWILYTAGVYAYRGDKNEAYRYLNMFNQKCDAVDLMSLTYLERDPLLDNIRDEPEFQRLLREYEAKYEAGHESVRKWLDEQDSL